MLNLAMKIFGLFTLFVLFTYKYHLRVKKEENHMKLLKKLEQARHVYLNHQHGSLRVSDTITRTIDGEQI